MARQLPKDFLWCGSVSATQIEGGWDEGGKSPVQPDFAAPGGTSGRRKVYFRNADGTRGSMDIMERLPKGARYEIFDDLHYPNHVAADFYHRWEEDIDLYAELGITAFNTTISWARIYPHGVAGGVNAEGVEFYRKVFTRLREKGIEPVITLYKYDEPVYFEETIGGWENRQMIEEFCAFARTCLTEYRGLVSRWITFNEINVLLAWAKRGEEAPMARTLTELHNQMVAAARTVRMAHEIDSANRVGCMIAGMCCYPLTPDPADVIANQRIFQDQFCYCADTMVRGAYPRFAQRLWDETGFALNAPAADFEDLARGRADFLAFSYYMSFCYTTHKDDEARTGGNLFSGAHNRYLDYSDWGWAMDPTGFRYFLNELWDRYNVPLLDVENGLGAFDEVGQDGAVHDSYRIDYLRAHIASALDAVRIDGVDLMGYTIWGFEDLVSFTSGQMEKRYGVIHVDMDDAGNGTLARTKKDSFAWFQRVIASHGTEL